MTAVREFPTPELEELKEARDIALSNTPEAVIRNMRHLLDTALYYKFTAAFTLPWNTYLKYIDIDPKAREVTITLQPDED